MANEAPGRNDPCHCGSGKKYKKCCLVADESRIVSETRRKTAAEQTFRCGLQALRLGELETAQKNLQQAVDSEPENADYLNKLGYACYLQHQYPQAIDTYRRALEQRSPFIEASHNLALSYLGNGDLDLAQDTIEQVIALAPQTAIAYNCLGEILEAKHLSERAEAAYKKALALDDTLTAAHNNIGSCLRRAGRDRAALVHFQRAIALAPQMQVPRLNLGKTWHALGENDNAREEFERVVELNPDNWEAQFNLGLCHQSAGSLQSALNCYQKTVHLKPEHFQAFNNIGVLLRQDNQLAKSRTFYEKSLRVNPEYSPALQNLGEWFQLEGDLDRAIELFRQSISAALKDENAAVPVESKKIVVEEATRALMKAQELLNSADIPFFLIAGTLLGVYRDGKLLPHDKDMDIGVDWSIDREKLLHVLCASGDFSPARFRLNVPLQERWKISVVHSKSDISLDIFFHRKDGEGVLCGVDHFPVPNLSRPKAFTLKTLNWQDLDWLIPDPVEHYLEDFYGDKWRVPDPYFDTILSSRCKTPESFEVRRCFGYNRLYGAISAGDWKKAQNLCEQIQSIRYDDYLNDLEPALRKFIA